MIDKLKNIVEERRESFRGNINVMVSSYNQELETTEGYNGRQILELIQNCDDEGADKVLITLNKDESTLTIANTGKPFSLKGYRSIIYSNLSPKDDKKRFIGNKGLGFRSLVYWADEIQIHSNDILLNFSHTICRNEFEQMFDAERREKITEEYSLRKNTIPLSMLAIPEIKEERNSSNYTTEVKVRYKEEFLNDIHKQVEQLRPEILLFLHHIERISFVGFEDIEDLTCKKKNLSTDKEFGPSENVQVNKEHWQIFTKEGKINGAESDDDSGYYQLKLAVSESMNTEYPYLFTYFPTDIKLDFPYIIHGTFDLDQTRNTLNKTARNEEVLQELVGFIVETAKFYTKDEVNWRPFQLLHFDENSKHNRLDELGFYEDMLEAVLNEKIFPCLDGMYRALDDVVYLDNEFSRFVLENGFNSYFPNMLIPTGEVSLEEYTYSSEVENIEEIIDQISSEINDHEIRARLIFLVNNHFPENRFRLIIDSKSHLIDKNNEVFTPVKNEIQIPSYCNIQFINRTLYDCLIEDFDLDGADHKARELAKRLRLNSNLYSYEPQYLIRKIISRTKEILEDQKGQENKVEVVNEMVLSLYRMYENMSEPSSLEINEIPLLNLDSDVKFSSDLYLNDFFETGKKSNAIFKKIRSNDEILAYPTEFGLESEHSDDLERFFIWLGVNEYVRYKYVEAKSLEEKDQDYIRFVLQKKGISKDTFRFISYLRIDNIDQILQELAIEELISWFHFDSKIHAIINGNNDYCKLEYFYYSPKPISHFTTYLAFKLQQHGFGFKNHLVESKLNWANEINIDFNHKLFKSLNIESFEIASVLKSLGGKSSFSDLTIDRVSEIIKSFPKKFPNGDNSQTLYRLAVRHYSENGKLSDKDFNLFAKTGEDLEILSSEEIYFSDRVKLPSNLQSKFPTLNFPARSGAVKAIEFFGINDLADVEITVTKHHVNENLNSDFESYLESLKPYLLLYRLDQIESQELKEAEAENLKKLTIKICDELVFEIEHEVCSMDLYEYVAGENPVYFIHCNTTDKLSNLINNSKFSDSFSNILSDLFDVSSDKHAFRSIFRNGVKDAKHIAKQEFGSELIEESKLLLGLGNNQSAFWSAVYKVLEKPYKDIINPATDLDLKTDIRKFSYENINSRDNLSIVKHLFNELDITAAAFNSYSSLKLDFSSKHRELLKQKLFTLSRPFRLKLWEKLSDSGIDEKKKLLQKWFDFENCEEEIKEFALRYKEVLAPDYNKFFKNKLLEFDFTLKDVDSPLQNEIDLDELFESNIEQFNQDEIDEIFKRDGLKSLLYFTSDLEYIRNEISDELTQDEEDSSVDANESDEENNSRKSSIKVEMGKKLSPSKSSDGLRKTKPYQPRENQKENKRVGNDCEDLAKQILEETYGKKNVDLVSRRDEGTHYDIRYSPDEGETWKYVEVKNYAKGRFSLSKEQKFFGEKNSQNYEIHLVDLNNKVVYPITDPYNTSSLEFVDKEYWVYYQLVDQL